MRRIVDLTDDVDGDGFGHGQDQNDKDRAAQKALGVWREDEETV